MRANFRISSLVPSGLVIESVSNAAETIVVTVRRGSGMAVCPLCNRPSQRVHSRYVRGALDLPCSGQSVRLRDDASLLLRDGGLPQADIRGTVRGRCSVAAVTANGAAGASRPSSGARARRQAGR